MRLPLGFGRAEMIVTEPAPLMTIGGVDGNGLYGRQTLRGNLAFGGGPHEWIELALDGPAATALHSAVAQPRPTRGGADAQARRTCG